MAKYNKEQSEHLIVISDLIVISGRWFLKNCSESYQNSQEPNTCNGLIRFMFMYTGLQTSCSRFVK